MENNKFDISQIGNFCIGKVPVQQIKSTGDFILSEIKNPTNDNVNENYNKAYVEVIALLSNITPEDISKIPEEVLKLFEEKKHVNYNYEIDLTKEFEEQNMLDETCAIFANIFRDYWATPEQKARILAKQANELIKLEKEKKLKNSNIESNTNVSIFRENKNRIIKNTDIQPKESLQLITYNKQSWYKKALQIIKTLFSKTTQMHKKTKAQSN